MLALHSSIALFQAALREPAIVADFPEHLAVNQHAGAARRVVLQRHPSPVAVAGREVRPRLGEDVGMEVDREHYLATGAGGGGTGMTCPHFLQVRSDSSA